MGADTSKRPGAILFVCGQNAIRSPLAERLAKDLIGFDSFIQSAGVIAGERDPLVDVVLSEIGIDPGVHRPRAIEELDDGFYDVVIALSDIARSEAERHWANAPVSIEFWPIADPSEGTGRRDQMLDGYRAVRDDLKQRLSDRFGS